MRRLLIEPVPIMLVAMLQPLAVSPAPETAGVWKVMIFELKIMSPSNPITLSEASSVEVSTGSVKVVTEVETVVMGKETVAVKGTLFTMTVTSDEVVVRLAASRATAVSV